MAIVETAEVEVDNCSLRFGGNAVRLDGGKITAKHKTNDQIIVAVIVSGKRLEINVTQYFRGVLSVFGEKFDSRKYDIIASRPKRLRLEDQLGGKYFVACDSLECWAHKAFPDLYKRGNF